MSLPTTEQRNPRSTSLGSMSAPEVLALMDEEEWQTAAAVKAAAPSIAAAAEQVAASIQDGRRIILLGAGTSGRLAIQEVAELRPTFGVPEGQFLALVAGGPSCGPAAITASEDDEHAPALALAELVVGPGDGVLAVAASGTTPFVLAGIRAARAAGAWTCAIANNPGTPVLGLADIPILLDTGPEILTGSTRLRAGTAQKLTLNRITTAAMVLDGRVIENHMVDMVASLEKLRLRALRIVCDLTGVGEQQARDTLERCGWSVRPALRELDGLRDGAQVRQPGDGLGGNA